MDQQQVMRITKALADPTRFRILQAIAAARRELLQRARHALSGDASDLFAASQGPDRRWSPHDAT